jgi:hypothetical protein
MALSLFTTPEFGRMEKALDRAFDRAFRDAFLPLSAAGHAPAGSLGAGTLAVCPCDIVEHKDKYLIVAGN